jgi:choline dehydrogenase-like flavoprotein
MFFFTIHIRKLKSAYDRIEPINREKIYCEDAVILAGGAINTPQLLMLSGIGSGGHLYVSFDFIF